MMDEIIVRPAVREDCEGIRSLIQELADFEHMSNGPKIGADTLERDGFDEHPLFKCFVAERSNKLVGYTLYFLSYSTWGGKAMHMEDIYVSPDVRGQGVGSRLLNAVAKETIDQNCCRLDFSVLKWNPAVRFYKQRGAVDLTETEEWHHYRLSLEALRGLT